MSFRTIGRQGITDRAACRWALLAVVSIGLLARVAFAQVTLNLKDADIQSLVATVAEITGKNFVIDPRVRGRVSLISAKPLEADEIYDVFLSILAAHGFAAVPGENLIKIVPAAGVKQDAIPTVDQRPEGGGDQAVTKVIDVHNASVDQLVAILRPLLPPEAHLAGYASSNVLVISASYANVERISEIVARIDAAADAGVNSIELRHAPAVEVADVLNRLETQRQQSDAAAAAKPVRLVADPRSNRLIVSGDRTGRDRLLAMARELDTPLQSGGNTQVFYLRYANANDLLQVLSGVSERLGETTDETASGAPSAPAESIALHADAATNALIITAPNDAMSALENVIAKLDIRRAQVLVEAVIAEVATDKMAELGVQWLVDGTGEGSIVGIANFDNPSFAGLSVGETLGAVANEQIPSSLPSGAALAIGDFTGSVRFGVLLSALASDADTNILATPNLMTLDNEEAEIVVGQNVPFVTGTYATDSSGEGVSNPFQTIERRDVGLTLRVKPQINAGNTLQLSITQELSSVVPTSSSLAQGPTTSKRAIRTNVMLEDGQILVLGGLISDSLNETEQKVPGLGDLPVLGSLFRYRQTAKEKRNLMIFIHPQIVRDPRIGAERSARKYTFMRERQLEARNDTRTRRLLSDEVPVLKPEADVRRDRTVLVEPRRALPERTEPVDPPRTTDGLSRHERLFPTRHDVR